jgi:apolipoprotein N-acyltransferase
MKLSGLSNLKSVSLAVLASLLLFLSFPKFDLPLLVWVGLVPLHWITLEARPRSALLLSSLTGFLFLTLVFSWILSVPGYRLGHHLILGLYSSLFFGLYGIAINFISRRLGLVRASLCAPALWVTMEYSRSNLVFLSLPWALLSHSQYENLPVIQIASFTGAYGISFLIVLINSAIYLMIRSRIGSRSGSVGLASTPIKIAKFIVPMTSIVLLILVLVYGYQTVSRPNENRPIRASVLQGNIGQEMKGNPRLHGTYIMDRYTELTRKATQDKPDLIVWPETATPGFILLNRALMIQLKSLITEVHSYFLIGTSEVSKFGRSKPGPIRYGNTAVYLSPEGNLLGQYLKIRLVPFGEYIPLGEYFNWPRSVVPDPEKFREVSGKTYTLFDLRDTKFGVVICWEHVFPDLFRNFVKNGANFMLNITNEAWFGDTAAPYQMLAISVFRAVENQCAIARAANTGISCFIDSHGKITGRVQNGQKKDTFIAGWLTGEIVPSTEKTFYTRHGDIFAFFCIIASIVMLLTAWGRSQNTKRMKRHED